MAPGDEFAAKAAVYCVFVDNPGTLPDPTPDAPDPDDLDNPTSRPGRSALAPCILRLELSCWQGTLTQS